MSYLNRRIILDEKEYIIKEYVDNYDELYGLDLSYYILSGDGGSITMSESQLKCLTTS